MALDKSIHCIDIIIARELLVEYKVAQDYCRCPAHAGSAVNVDFEALFVDELVEELSTFEHALSQMLLVEIVDWVVHGRDTSDLVVLTHLWPVDASVSDVNVCLDVEDSSHAGLMQGFCVLLKLRVGPNEDACFANFVEGKTAYEVGISLFNVAVDDEGLVNVAPHV